MLAKLTRATCLVLVAVLILPVLADRASAEPALLQRQLIDLDRDGDIDTVEAYDHNEVRLRIRGAGADYGYSLWGFYGFVVAPMTNNRHVVVVWNATKVEVYAAGNSGLWKMATRGGSDFTHVSAHDVDGDALSDIVAVDRDSVDVLYGSAWGAPFPVGTVAIPTTQSWSFAHVGDLTGDRFPEVVVIGNGKGSASAGFRVIVNAGPRRLVDTGAFYAMSTGNLAWWSVGDHNNDTRVDVFLATAQDHRSYQGDGRGGFMLGVPPKPTAKDRPAVHSNGWFSVVNTLGAVRADAAYPFGAGKGLLCDWDGNGTKTPGTFDAGSWEISNTLGWSAPVENTFTFGEAGDTPLCGDWNGDGFDTPGVRRGGTFFLLFDWSGPTYPIFYGGAGDVPVVGDWNGDGVDTLGVRRGREFHLTNGFLGATDYRFDFGYESDVPVAGDWDGDGRDGIGVFRDGTTWFLRDTLTDGVAERWMTFGAGGAPLAW